MTISASGKQGKLVIARLHPNISLFEGINEILDEHKIESGYIPVLHGCLSNCTILTVAKNPECKGNPLDVTINLEGPLVFSGTGTIARDIDGKRFIHVHPQLSTADGITYTGHLIKGTVILTTEIVIVEAENIIMNRKPDPKVFDNILLNVESINQT